MTTIVAHDAKSTSVGFVRDPLNVILDCENPLLLSAAINTYAAYADICVPASSDGSVLRCVVDPAARDDLLGQARGDVAARTAGTGSRTATAAVLRRSDATVLVLGDQSRSSQVILDRELRRLFTEQFLEAGWLPLHAAAVSVSPDRAILLLGRKKAGKTTTLLRLLRSGADGIVSNDKVFVAADSKGAPRCRSLPVSVGVRADVLPRFPELAELHEVSVDLHIDNGAPSGRLLVPLPKLAACFGVQVRHTAVIAGFADVRYDPTRSVPRSRPLPTTETVALLTRERLDNDSHWQRNWLGENRSDTSDTRGGDSVIATLSSVPAISADITAGDDASVYRVLTAPDSFANARPNDHTHYM